MIIGLKDFQSHITIAVEPRTSIYVQRGTTRGPQKMASKLVRDRILEIIAADGRQAAWYTAEGEGVILLLKEKLRGESKDFSDQSFRYAKQLLARRSGPLCSWRSGSRARSSSRSSWTAATATSRRASGRSERLTGAVPA
ncbi:MAG: hypothetical protein PHE95_01760 [Candidatus Methanomethylophilus sp.]|nr:hypothetical protein [Methanomethylophilus sp.]